MPVYPGAPRPIQWRSVSRQVAKGFAELPGKVNYILGNDPRNWQIGLPTWARVTYPDTYPGIDVIYYGSQQQLEFDLVVKLGADPGSIRMKIEGGGREAEVRLLGCIGCSDV
jgi:hypothetical protein